MSLSMVTENQWKHWLEVCPFPDESCMDYFDLDSWEKQSLLAAFKVLHEEGFSLPLFRISFVFNHIKKQIGHENENENKNENKTDRQNLVLWDDMNVLDCVYQNEMYFLDFHHGGQSGSNIKKTVEQFRKEMHRESQYYIKEASLQKVMLRVNEKTVQVSGEEILELWKWIISSKKVWQVWSDEFKSCVVQSKLEEMCSSDKHKESSKLAKPRL